MYKAIRPGKKYTMFDYVRLPFGISPLYSAVILATQVLGALIPSVTVFITAKFIDTAIAIFNGQAARGEIFPSLVLLALTVAYSYFSWQFLSFINIRFEILGTRTYRDQVLRKLASLEYRHIENNDTWDLIMRVCSDPFSKMMNGAQTVIGIITISVRVVSMLAVLMSQVWWAGLVLIAISVPLFFLAVKGGKATYAAGVEAQKHTRRANYYRDVLQKREFAEERTLFGYTETLNKRWFEKYEAARKINQKVTVKYFIRMKGSSLVTVLISASLIAALIFPLRDGAISVGMFMGLVTNTLGLVQMMSWQLANTMSGLAAAREYLKDYTSFCALSETPDALGAPDFSAVPEFESIELKDVRFSYPGTEKEILKGLSLRIENGKHYAFVGVNGAGKTTVTKLLTGLYDNYEGEILINGRSLRDYPLSALKGLFSVVYQDFSKYSVSIAENLTLCPPEDRDGERLSAAVRAAGLEKCVEELPNGAETNLGKIRENSADLSGGQWQRVAIARALYNPARVRILDEPTAALDPAEESAVYELFGRVSAGIPTVFITHRLGAARLADEIIVIDGGVVREQGSHAELLALGGIYAQMFESQRSWYK